MKSNKITSDTTLNDTVTLNDDTLPVEENPLTFQEVDNALDINAPTSNNSDKGKKTKSLRKNKKLRFRKSVLGLPYGIFMIIFIILPILLLLVYAFSKKGALIELTWDFTFENFAYIFSSNTFKVIWRSLWIGLVTTIICFVIGYPIAYFLASKRYNYSKTLVMLFVLPMWINFLLRTLATKAVFDFLNIDLGVGAVIFGMVYNFLPFMILPLYTTISKIDNSLLEASRDLGASDTKSFFKITVPLSLPGIISGVTMVFTPSISTFVISDMLSNNKFALIGNLINLQVEGAGMNYNIASALSLLLLVLIGISMLFVNKYDKDNTSQGGGLW